MELSHSETGLENSSKDACFCEITFPRIMRNDCVFETPCRMSYWGCSVFHCIELIQPAWLEARGHEQEITSCSYLNAKDSFCAPFWQQNRLFVWHTSMSCLCPPEGCCASVLLYSREPNVLYCEGANMPCKMLMHLRHREAHSCVILRTLWDIGTLKPTQPLALSG